MHLRRLWIFLGIIYIGIILAGSLLRTPDVNLSFNFIDADKVIHFLMYFILVGWFVQLYHTRSSRLLILSGAVLLGMGIEFLQGMTTYRSFDYIDGIANSIGASCAFLLAKTRFSSILSSIDLWVYHQFNQV